METNYSHGEMSSERFARAQSNSKNAETGLTAVVALKSFEIYAKLRPSCDELMKTALI